MMRPSGNDSAISRLPVSPTANIIDAGTEAIDRKQGNIHGERAGGLA
jgi:hypothetical protein